MKKPKKGSKQEYEFTFNGTTYLIAKGGLHSKDKSRKIIPLANEILRDADIGSQYPWSLIKRSLYPKHLGKEWLIGYEDIFDKRIAAKKEKKNSIAEAFKLSMNGGGYGKLGEEFNWQFSPETMYAVTIGNQMEILMLIEALEVEGIHCVSANTDGIVCLFHKDLDKKYYEICNLWEQKVGNHIKGKLEYIEYSKIIQTSVNDYIAQKTNGELKFKGDYVIDFELHKNKSKRIVPIALKEYFINSIPILETITNHKNIFDFCLGAKSKGEGKYIHLSKDTGEEIELQKVNRYFVSNDGWNLLKRLPPLPYNRITKQINLFTGDAEDGTRESEVEAGYLTTVMNKYIKKDIKDYNINYKWYIDQAMKIINQIE